MAIKSRQMLGHLTSRMPQHLKVGGKVDIGDLLLRVSLHSTPSSLPSPVLYNNPYTGMSGDEGHVLAKVMCLMFHHLSQQQSHHHPRP